MTTSSHKRTLSLVIGLTMAAALLWGSTVGGRTSTPQDNKPTTPGIYLCDDSGEGYRATFSWTRPMPGNGAWLGTMTLRQGTRVVLSKPIQVFDASSPSNPTDPVIRQFQAQDGSFYCKKMEISYDKKTVYWSECRNWLLADQSCVRVRPGTEGGE